MPSTIPSAPPLAKICPPQGGWPHPAGGGPATRCSFPLQLPRAASSGCNRVRSCRAPACHASPPGLPADPWLIGRWSAGTRGRGRQVWALTAGPGGALLASRLAPGHCRPSNSADPRLVQILDLSTPAAAGAISAAVAMNLGRTRSYQPPSERLALPINRLNLTLNSESGKPICNIIQTFRHAGEQGL